MESFFTWLFGTKKSATTSSIKENREIIKTQSLAIDLSENEWKKYDKLDNKICNYFLKEIKASPLFTKEGANEIVQIVREGYTRGGRIDFKPIFSKGILLSLDEKRKYGLNTRLKYSSFFVGTLTEFGIKSENPKEVLENLYNASYHRAHREAYLKRIKKIGITKVKITSCEDGRDCQCSKQVKGVIFDINNVPSLPLAGCDAAYCRCSYDGQDDLFR